jgi:hypothetical protein
MSRTEPATGDASLAKAASPEAYPGYGGSASNAGQGRVSERRRRETHETGS